MCDGCALPYSARGLNVGKKTGGIVMPRYLVERTFPQGFRLSGNDESASICQAIIVCNSEDNVTWIHSYVSNDRQKTFCLCDAPSPEAIRRTAARNNLPVDRITRVSVLNPYFLTNQTT
jgi:hypothetical protein